MHWLKLVVSWACAFVAISLVTTLLVGRKLPEIGYLLLFISIASMIGTLQYRRDLGLSVKESTVPWVMTIMWMAGFAFWSVSVDGSVHSVQSDVSFSVVFAICMSVGCLFPLRWVIATLGPSRFAP
ncbi:hypothetical protein FNZ56_04800 [Pseudoluteimonas lycopersici]|uniref:Uncharacterized protein n=1 Tax=Pseudoluteimonas lycopersici TaxID=1324796 RepID=A0A516V3Z7_9GAMM|nr:hypothetical protein [Lysobacter lycopersici]QDQ73233.1 hypothetical protein FNZ56_04800 [Lysobacter lycopersici]